MSRKVERADVDAFYIPATKLAVDNKIPTLANMIIVGKVMKELGEFNEESLTKLKDCTKWHFDCKLAMLVCYNKDECWTRRYDGAQCGVVDASIVTTHLMLAAHEIGIGSTWVMSYNPEKNS